CEDALNLYKQRWEIELVNDFYKNTLELETVRQHDDYSVYGDEFLNMLTLIIGNRIKNKFADSRILETKTYRDVMKIFKQYKKIQMPYKNDIWYETELPKKSMELIEKILYS
ncbi:transposase, partial [Mycoplasmopsis bovis]